jgi:hypothetical protein
MFIATQRIVGHDRLGVLHCTPIFSVDGDPRRQEPDIAWVGLAGVIIRIPSHHSVSVTIWSVEGTG